MSDQTDRFEWITKLARIWLIGALGFLSLALIATVAVVVTFIIESREWMRIAPWVLMAVIELVGAVWVFIIYGIVRTTAANELALGRITDSLERAERIMQSQAGSLNRLIDLASLSDQARSLIYREREIEAFRETIHDDLMRQDYKSAEALIDTIRTRFNYLDEAQRLQKELTEAQKATLEEKVDAAANRIQAILDRYDWARAIRETQRLLRLLPGNAKIAALPERIESAKALQKRSLLQSYGEAVRKNDIDRGIELLKELDGYLAPQEAAALEESARGVFKAKLHNLGVRFAISVTDQQWNQAVATGEEIVRGFPNSLMSREVRQKMDQLRQRAAAAANE